MPARIPEPAPASPRLMSLDALRGFDMLWITGVDGLSNALTKLAAGPAGRFVAGQLRHSPWAGFTFCDLIFPLFVFMVGNSIAFSITRLVETEGRAGAIRRIIRRTLVMFVLGIFYNGGLAAGLDGVRWGGVLQRLAACYFAASLLFIYLRPRTLIAICLVVLAGYWALLALVPVPGFGAGDFAEGHNLANWIDRLGMPGRQYNGDHDPEGYLSTLPAIVSCLLGVLSSLVLRDPACAEKKKVTLLAVGGLVMLAVGWGWGLEFPVIKKIWTSSYVLVAGGWSLLLLAAFYLVIDVWKIRAWATPFVWIGTNALTIYLICNIVDLRTLAKRFVGSDLTAWLDGRWTGLGGLAAVLVSLALTLAICRFLFTRRIFLRL